MDKDLMRLMSRAIDAGYYVSYAGPCAPLTGRDLSCERLFGANARPHVLALQRSAEIDTAMTPEMLAYLEKYRFGPAVFWGTLYTNDDGITPDHGTYTYAEPGKVGRAQEALREIGLSIVGYVNCPACIGAGMTPWQILDMIERHVQDGTWSGVYLDNANVLDGVWAALDFMQRVRHIVPGSIMHHASYEPAMGQPDYRGPWAHLEDYTIIGESRKIVESMGDPRWKHLFSQAGRSGSIGIWTPTNDSTGHSTIQDHADEWVPFQPGLLMGFIVRLKREWKKWFDRFYQPAHAALAKQYQANPAAFVERARHLPLT